MQKMYYTKNLGHKHKLTAVAILFRYLLKDEMEMVYIQ